MGCTSRNGYLTSKMASSAPGHDAWCVACFTARPTRARGSAEVFRVSGKEREEVARHQPYESGSVTPNAIKIAMRAKQAPVSRSVLILGMKSMK